MVTLCVLAAWAMCLVGMGCYALAHHGRDSFPALGRVADYEAEACDIASDLGMGRAEFIAFANKRVQP